MLNVQVETLDFRLRELKLELRQWGSFEIGLGRSARRRAMPWSDDWLKP
jgi:hypothetical protein